MPGRTIKNGTNNDSNNDPNHFISYAVKCQTTIGPTIIAG